MSVPLSKNDLEAIRQLLKIVTDNQLSELTITLGDGISITIKTTLAGNSSQAVSYAPQLHAQTILTSGHSPALSAPAAPAVKRGVPVTSPMVGIFYHAASPGEPAFVKLGDTVRVGQTIGLIEAMKVFSEIPSEAAGKVTEIVVENGQLVQLGQPLFFLEPA